MNLKTSNTINTKSFFCSKYLLCLIIITSIFVLIYIDTILESKKSFELWHKQNRTKYSHNCKKELDTSLASKETCPKQFFNKTIYLIESKRLKNHTLNLGPRQACAVESAAKNNKNWNVTLFALDVNDLSENSSYITPLRSYQNINIINTTLVDFTKNTVAEAWINKHEIEKSKFRVAHYSDFMRLLVLWKYGGVYLDTDFIVLKSFDDLIPNWSVAETNYWVASAAMSFYDTGFGRYVTEKLLKEFMKTYNASVYAYNGPGLLTRVAQRLCSITNTAEMNRKNCFDFEVLPTKLFYPVGYNAFEPLFSEKELNKTLELVKDSYAVHCWNGLIGAKHLKVGTKAALGVLAERNCPKVYAATKELFR